MKITSRIHSSRLAWPLAIVLAVLGIHKASAQLVLEFGDPGTLLPISNFELQPNEVRTIAVLVENNSGSVVRLSGYSMELGIGGGGPPLGGIVGPIFTQPIDLVTGTPFAGDHGAPVINGGPNLFVGGPNGGVLPQYLGLSLTTTSAAVPPETVGAVSLATGRSLLATLTVSASGFSSPQSWALAFTSDPSASFFNDAFNNSINPSFQNATISVVPEPATVSLACALVLLLWAGFKKAWPAFSRVG